MNSPKVRLITTQDGSNSLYLNDLDETYHSTKGALGESAYIYIEQGINTLTHRKLTLFEVGFGTGLNALLTFNYALKKKINVSYHTLEPYPIPEAFVSQLGYAKNPKESDILNQMHGVSEDPLVLDPLFTFQKYHCTLEKFSSEQLFDIIYFDAFAPSKQPDIWARPNLEKAYSLLMPGGILVTYCAQGQFKRDLAAIGYEVEILPGAMGKKEMVRAKKK